jgi:hypothetical protein
MTLLMKGFRAVIGKQTGNNEQNFGGIPHVQCGNWK